MRSHSQQRSPEPANEAASDPDIAPNAQSGATPANTAPPPPIPPPAQSEEAEKDVSPSGLSAWDATQGAIITVLKMTKEASKACPPLEAAVGALMPLLEIIQASIDALDCRNQLLISLPLRSEIFVQ